MTAKTTQPNQTETLAFALYLAAIAPDDERSEQALAWAEQIASNMTANQTETLAFGLFIAAIAPDDERSEQALALYHGGRFYSGEW